MQLKRLWVSVSVVLWSDESWSWSKLSAASVSWSSAHYSHTWPLRTTTEDLICEHRQEVRRGRIRADATWHDSRLSFYSLVASAVLSLPSTPVSKHKPWWIQLNSSCGSEKTQPDSSWALRFVFFCLILLKNTRIPGDVGFEKKSGRVWAKILSVCSRCLLSATEDFMSS